MHNIKTQTNVTRTKGINNMKNKIIFTLTITLIVVFSSCSKDGGLVDSLENAITFNYNGQNREYLFYKPDNLPANSPLVVVMHGYGESPTKYFNHIRFNQIADTAKFAVCYPKAIDLTWDTFSLNSTDLGFVKALTQELQDQHSLNPNKTFATGFSMGGAMSNLLALEDHSIFTAVAPVAGYVTSDVWNEKNPQNPIPVFLIHGTDDQVVSIDGYYGGPSVATLANYYATLNNCTITITSQFTTNTNATYHENGTNDNEVWYYRITGHDHVFPGDTDPKAMPYDNSGFNGVEEIWRFFSKW